MGLHIHSLGQLPAEIPPGIQKEYFVYLLDYGWREPLGKALIENFDRMADLASQSYAVVLRGTPKSHFEDEVLSWHHVNGQPADNLLPAILITTRPPHEFRDAPLGRKGRPDPDDYPLVLIPLRDHCKTVTDVAVLISKIFTDIQERKALSDFEVAKLQRAGIQGALVDAVVLKPSIAGMGIDLKELAKIFFRRKSPK